MPSQVVDGPLFPPPSREEDEAMSQALKPRMTPQRLRSQVMTVGRLFDALDELADKLHAPRTIPPSPAVILCQELKRVITEQITREYEDNG